MLQVIGSIFISPILERRKRNIFVEAELLKDELNRCLWQVIPDYGSYDINFVFKQYKREGWLSKGIIKGQYLYELTRNDEIIKLLVYWEKIGDDFTILDITRGMPNA